MPVVRPIGEVGLVGLVLPTTPQGERAGEKGGTDGTTNGAASATRAITSGTSGWDGPSIGQLAETCRQAEAAGASALWAVDHLFWPRPMLECLTALTVAATAAERAVIGSCVVQVALRSPAALAKQALTLQALTGGRFVLGVGAGSHPGEYEAAGVDFAARGRLLDAGIEAVRAAWATAGPEADGAPYRQLPGATPPPVWVGGSSPAAIRRAATVGDGWIPLFVEPDELAAGCARIGQLAEDAGRDPRSVIPAVVVFVHVGPNAPAAERGGRWLSSLYGIPAKAFARHLIAGPASECAGQIECYLAAGARHVAVMVADDHPLEHFAAVAGALGATGHRSAPTRPRSELVEVTA